LGIEKKINRNIVVEEFDGIDNCNRNEKENAINIHDNIITKGSILFI